MHRGAIIAAVALHIHPAVTSGATITKSSHEEVLVSPSGSILRREAQARPPATGRQYSAFIVDDRGDSEPSVLQEASDQSEYETTLEGLEKEALLRELTPEHKDAIRQGKTRTLVFTSRASDHFGDALMAYWNARATAFLEGLAFRWEGPMPEERGGDDMLRFLPRYSPAGEPSAHQRQLYSVMKAPGFAVELCLTCSRPYQSPFAPWHLFREQIQKETQALVRQLEPKQEQDMPEERDAVVHISCDEEIMGAGPDSPRGAKPARHDYGLLPHRFILDQLPNDVSRVIFVHKPAIDATVCDQSISDFKEVMEQGRNLEVLTHSSSMRSDWLFMATAPVLFCAPSAYCTTAALGNNKTVFVAVNGNSSAVVAPSPTLGPWDQLSPKGQESFWVESDYMPGTALSNIAWVDLQEYLRSSNCDANATGCLPRIMSVEMMPSTKVEELPALAETASLTSIAVHHDGLGTVDIA